MSGWRSAMMAMILLAGCTAMAPPGSRRGAVDSISFQLNSWGSPVEGFTIASDGRGEFRKAPAFRAEPRVTRFNAGRAGFARIQAALAPVRRHAGSEVPCGQRMTDFPYGDIVWESGSSRATVSLNVGCRSAEMQAVVARAQQATTLAEGFARTNAAP
ncbi:MAG TPA: hypothetical protein VEC11_12025 [Allosphingosinicella sp.]|nr:hypothetical protein [Allosphingosinicella sp.]